MFTILLLVVFLISYLLGSLSSAIIICKLFKLPDPRTQGSGNPGATNVMRIGGKKAAYLTFLGDFLKGFLPVLIIHITTQNSFFVSAAAIGAFIGHLYPVFFGFKGGKGVATFVGIIAAINGLLLLSFILTWLLILYVSGYVSLASIASSILLTLISWFVIHNPVITATLIILTLLVIIKHHTNIKNLINGTEKGFKKTS